MSEEEIEKLTPEERKAYNALQIWIVVLNSIFCTLFVLCISSLVYTTGNWKLMWFYLMPLMAYLWG